MHFLHINMFFFYLIYIIFLLRRTRWVSDALKDLRGRFSIFAPFCCKCLPFNFQFLSKMLLMCFFFWSKKLSCILMVFLNELFIFFPDHLHWQLWTVTLYGICTAALRYLVLLWDLWDITEADPETLLHSIWNTFKLSLAASGY